MTMKRFAIFFAVAACVLASCSTEARYDYFVDIDVNIKHVGAGYCEIEYTPHGDTWYLAGVVEAEPGVDPLTAKRQFMNLALDEAYKDYINWRHQMLVEVTPHIADFASHSLKYGITHTYYQYLMPETDYWLFCFPVDPSTNKPSGDLYLKTIRTESESKADISFEYRIKGGWDYIYPKDKQGKIVDNIPWVGYTVDEEVLKQQEIDDPYYYFSSRYYPSRYYKNANIFYGMYAHNNNGYGDGTSDTLFEIGHTYYTGIFVYDANISRYNIFRFTWKGPDMELYLVPNN